MASLNTGGILGTIMNAMKAKKPGAVGVIPALGKTDADGRVSAETYYGTGQGSTLDKTARDAMNPNAAQTLTRSGGNLGLQTTKKKPPNMMLNSASSATGALRGLSGGLI
jgi:hypothetical protein